MAGGEAFAEAAKALRYWRGTASERNTDTAIGPGVVIPFKKEDHKAFGPMGTTVTRVARSGRVYSFFVRGRKPLSPAAWRYLKSAAKHEGERKSFHHDQVALDVQTAGVQYMLSDIPLGTTPNPAIAEARAGGCILPSSLILSYWVNQPSAKASSAQIRVMVVQWFPPLAFTGTPVTPSSLLQRNEVTVSKEQKILAPFDHRYKGRIFRVLYDKTHDLGRGTYTANQVMQRQMIVDFKPDRAYKRSNALRYNDAVTVAASDTMVSGSLWLVAFSDKDAVNTGPDLFFETRLNFYDNYKG